MRNYFAAQTFLGGRHERTVPGIRSTRVERITESAIALIYHGTRVVTYLNNGTFVLQSGGWHTNTTKTRINDYSPARVYQRNFNWYIMTKGGPVGFFDGMIVDANGEPVTHDESAFAPVPDEYNARKVNLTVAKKTIDKASGRP